MALPNLRTVSVRYRGPKKPGGRREAPRPEHWDLPPGSELVVSCEGLEVTFKGPEQEPEK